MSRLRCLLVGAQELKEFQHTLAIGLLKASVLADEALRGRVEVETLDLVAPSAEGVASAVVERSPDVVGFSCYLWNVSAFFAALAEVRRALPRALIVLGGPQVYPRARAVLEERPEVDAVVIGEGERTLPRLLEARLRGGDFGRIPGLAFRAAGAIVQTPEPLPIQDLDAIPSAYLSGAVALSDDTEVLTFETSRGCPFDCKYCDWPARRSKPRNFSLDRVLGELAHVIARCPRLRQVWISDADLFVEKPRAKELLRRARAALVGTPVRVGMELYLGRLDDELIELLDFPNFVLQAGIQTTTPEALKAVDRFFHRDKIEAAVAKLRARTPATKLILELIYGLPGDTADGHRDSLDWALSLEPDMTTASHALVLPGADMGQHPERYEMTYDPGPPHRIRSTPTFSAEELLEADASSFAVFTLDHILPVHVTLVHLGGCLRGRRPRPFLTLYERFAERLQETGLLPPLSQTSIDGGSLRDSVHAYLAIFSDESRLGRMMAELRAFGAEVLADRGRLDALPAFERYWTVQENAIRWQRLARDGAAGIVEPLGRVWASGREILWLGLEDLFEESVLADRAPAAVETIHFIGPSVFRRGRCAARGPHVKSAAELPPPPAGAGAQTIVISHLYTRLKPSGRAELLDYASRRARPGGRLVVWDDLLGGSPLEGTFRSAVPWEPPSASWSTDDVAREFDGRGWQLIETAADPAPFRRFVFRSGS